MALLLHACGRHLRDHGYITTDASLNLVLRVTILLVKDKDRRFIKNWRPISLINVDVNFASKTIARR